MRKIPESELILNQDGSIYHLHVKPGEIANTIITVGDIDRVALVAEHLEEIELTRQNREFKTVTGWLNDKRISIISTGIGTDNIDIVINELDALVNIDFESRQEKQEKTQLTFIRVGTSGAVSNVIPLDSLLLSTRAIDLGNLSQYYVHDFKVLKSLAPLDGKVAIDADHDLINCFQDYNFIQGTTLTAPGFYGPQGRSILTKSTMDHTTLQTEYQKFNITNLEMETAGIYLLARLLGHRAISLNAILANRINGSFSTQPQITIGKLIKTTMEVISDDSTFS